MFYIAVLAYLFNCGENKEPKNDDFGAMFGSPRLQTISKHDNIVCGKKISCYLSCLSL